MKNSLFENPILIFLQNLVAAIIAYYIALLLHEWGHGVVAWLYGLKHSPFDIQYGGWFLQNADEHVDYDMLFNMGRNFAAGLIGIAGPIVSVTLVIICLILLNHKSFQHNSVKFIFIYWLLVINMIPTIQYFTVSTFLPGGDTGHFANGLKISAWWIFIPGTIFNIYLIRRILKLEIIRAYAFIPIKSILGQNIFLLATLSLMFLFIYTHGYNPLTDKGLDKFGKVLILISIAFVPILFIICNPMREWVQRLIYLKRSAM